MQLPSRSEGDRRSKKFIADTSIFEGIGPVTGEFHVYGRGRETQRRVPNIRLVANYLDESGGIRVFRDGIRVYNYGERGDDWLGLDLRRVNAPARRISNNIVLGAVHLSLKESTGLVEKTNREGFVENDASLLLRRIVLGAVATLEAERQIDKERIRRLTARSDDPVTARIERPIQTLRRELERQGVLGRFDRHVARIENDNREMQETLLATGMSGLNLAVVFHEVERGVRGLHQVIREGADLEGAARHARGLTRLLDGFSGLLRRDSKRRHSVQKLVDSTHQFNDLRFRHHRIQIACPLLQQNEPGLHSRFAFNLVLGALSNLVDNALYWLRVRWPDTPDTLAAPGTDKPLTRKLHIGVCRDFKEGPAIVVADNGIGFQTDAPEHLVRPFFTRKPDGMGLGLYYANLVMELNGGQLAFPQPGEVELPPGLDGAVVALIFGEDRR